MAEGRAGPGRPALPEGALPELVRRYLDRALPNGPPVPRQVRIRQEGEMRQKPGGRLHRFTAVERFAVDRIAFSWRARFPLAGPIALRVVDSYADGDGTLEVRALGLTVRRQSGPEIVTGQTLRYLAELPWMPHALMRNRELEWRELDGRTVEVAAYAGGDRLTVCMEFDGAGDVVRSSSQMRLLEIEKTWVPTPWGGEFRDFALLGGLRIPTRGEVYWDLDEGRFVYWRGTVVSAELVDG